MSVPGASTVGSMISRSINRITAKSEMNMSNQTKHWAKTAMMIIGGITVISIIAWSVGHHRDTEEGQKKVGKTVSNVVDLIVIYGVLILASLTLITQGIFALSVVAARNDFDKVSATFENWPSQQSSAEELFSGFSLNI